MPRAATAEATDAAPFRARLGGYVVDMIIFGAIAMVIVVAAGFVLLLQTDFAEQDASDAQLYTFLGIVSLGSISIWSGLNLALLVARGQTGGQYVAGLRLAREDGRPMTLQTAAAWWFCLNPLLFSWPMALVAGFPISVIMFLLLGRVYVFLFVLLVILCVVAPIVALISALADARNRALHDRVANVIVVPGG